MANCKHFETCGLTDEGDPQHNLCILHSARPDKDRVAFRKAFEELQGAGEATFRDIVFPERTDFSGHTFQDRACFGGATFIGDADFGGATFTKDADFTGATFLGYASFHRAIFTGEADFFMASFPKGADFLTATFAKRVRFMWTTFTEGIGFSEAKFGEDVDFRGARFQKGAIFSQAEFSRRANFAWVTFPEEAVFRQAKFAAGAEFAGATFGGPAIFEGAAFLSGSVSFNECHISSRMIFSPAVGQGEEAMVFRGVAVDFRRMVIEHPMGLILVRADLSRCRFLETNLRGVEFLGVRWPRKGGRTVVYDEINPTAKGEAGVRSRTEVLYAQLKKNYEDHGDYERAGDFHFGEKLMRLRSGETPLARRFLLLLYLVFGGFGEFWGYPALWFALVLALSTIGYMSLGLGFRDEKAMVLLSWENWWDLAKAAFYSFRALTLLRPDDLVPVGLSKGIHAAQSLLGPLLLTLTGLAIRQRLRR